MTRTESIRRLALMAGQGDLGKGLGKLLADSMITGSPDRLQLLVGTIEERLKMRQAEPGDMVKVKCQESAKPLRFIGRLHAEKAGQSVVWDSGINKALVFDDADIEVLES